VCKIWEHNQKTNILKSQKMARVLTNSCHWILNQQHYALSLNSITIGYPKIQLNYHGGPLMAFNLRNRSFVKLLDFTPEEIKFLLKLSADLKAAKYGGYEQPRLTGKNIALIFEKGSTRTRVSFEVAAYDQGAHTTYLGPSGTQIGHKESMKDTARVLGRVYDGIEYRGFAQTIVEELAEYAAVPEWNGLTNEYHPTQILADMLTMREHSGELPNAKAVGLPASARLPA